MFYIQIFLIPIIIGIIFRVLFLNKTKGYFSTVFALVVTAVIVGYAVYLYTWGHSGGNEGPGLLAVATATAFAGTLLSEAGIFIYRKSR